MEDTFRRYGPNGGELARDHPSANRREKAFSSVCVHHCYVMNHWRGSLFAGGAHLLRGAGGGGGPSSERGT